MFFYDICNAYIQLYVNTIRLTYVIVELLLTPLLSWLIFSEDCLLELIVSVLLSPWSPSVDITRPADFDFDLWLTGGNSYIDEEIVRNKN